MKQFLKLFVVSTLMIASANQAFAQIKDGEATVMQGSTTTVSIGAAYQSTLNRATNITYTWTAGSSAISIQSKTNKTCTIKGNTPGTAKLNYHCSYYIDGYYRTMDFYYDITVKSNTISVTRIEMTPSSATMEIGETLQLNATAYPTNAINRSLNWTTENYSVASVSNSGLVTARGEGKVWIWARAADGSGAGNYCVVTVNAPTKVSSIELSESEITMEIGEEHTLTTTVLPEEANNKTVIWTSSDSEVATVSNGAITAIALGECDITCISTDGSDISAVCHVVVNESEQYWLSVVVPNGNFAINVTDMEQINLKITPDEGYIINSITLDGVEQAHDNGVITLPKLTQNSTLNIVFSAGTITGIESVGGDNENLKVSVANRTVTVTGTPSTHRTLIYDTNGAMIMTATEDVFDLPGAGIYILRIGSRTFKLAIK